MRIQTIVPGPDTSILRILQYIVFGSIILYFGKDVFIPISFALLISFVLHPVCAWMEKKGIGRLTAILIALSLLIIAGLLLVALLIYQFASFLNELPALQEKLSKSIEDLSVMLVNVFGISLERQREWVAKLTNQSGSGILSIIRNAIATSAFSAVLLVIIPVYSALILYYRQHWMKIVQRLFPKENKESLHEIISQTVNTYYNFIKGMAIVYLVVGILNSIGLLLLGIPHALLFGFIASVLTFIPYVGIMVGSLLPIAIAWITYDSIWYPVGIIAIFAFIQYLEANVIFPFAVSNRLNVNTLVMLIAVFVGGILWGLAGMILFVPFLGIAKLIADHNPKWKTISMMLGMNDK
ncbi:AI-2E family transporter [Chryseolinea sp. H1M3-3]|uniref:AI-2E family transporter n=1 Tax=Chryseolinea sp. H1M3-3 TaxID=3034144 RepID=UPI0023EDA942|nr:AI-2E family transporter [Chryseolinea sp. H1M3-3]